jgi:alpha-D-ribose 1-methylphosphonate 5-triphosphate synthase subunit PhnH
MSDLTRRKFLAKTSVAVAGAAAVVPGLTAAMKLGTEPGAPGTQPDTSESLVIHVRDAASGEMSMLVGADQVIVRDQALALRLYAAARPRR